MAPSHPLDYSSVPSVNPSGATGARESIATNPSMFGGGIAEGLGVLGRGMEQAGTTGIDIAAQQAAIDGRTHAAEVHSWQSNQTTDATEKFLSLRGKAALEALPEYKKQIDDLHQQARDQAGNPFTTRLIDDQGRHLIDSSYQGAARHAATQRKDWETKTANDSAQSYGNRAVLSATTSPEPDLAGDPDVRHGLANSDNEIRNLYHGQGYDDPAIEAEVQKNRGRNVKSIVEQLARANGTPEDPSSGSVTRAAKFFESQKGKIDAGSTTAIANFLAGPLNQILGNKQGRLAAEMPPVPSRPEVVADVPAPFIGAIKNTEGYRSKAYWDVNHYSIGYGTRANSPDEVIDQAEATRRFNGKIDSAAKFVDSVNPNLDPGTRAALISLTHNSGEGWGSAGLGSKIRAGDLAAAKETFLQYNRAGGEVNEGLVQRRAREASWFGRTDISDVEASAPRLSKAAVMLKIENDPWFQDRPQVAAAARATVSRIYGNWESANEQNKASFTVNVKNSTAEALSTGKVMAPLGHEQFLMNYGPAEGEKAWQDYQANVQLGSDKRATASMTPSELVAMRQNYTPKPGETFVADQHRQQMLDKAIALNEKAKAEDPAGFLIGSTDFGAEAYKQFGTQLADKNTTPEMRTAYAGMYAEKMRAEQLRLGVAADKVQIVPQAYIDQLNTKLNNPALNGGSLAIAQGVDAEARLWGSHWPDVYRQLSDKAQPMVRVIGSGVKPEIAQALANLMPYTLAQILKDEDTEKAATVKKDVLDAFKPLARSMTATDGSIGVFNDFRGQAEKLAAQYVMEGATSGEAATKAFNGIVGFKYHFQDTYRIPKDIDVNRDLVARGTYAALRELKSGDIATARDTFGGLSPEYLANAPVEGLRRDGKWVTATGPGMDERGLFLALNGQVQRKPDGQPYFLPWSKLEALGAQYGGSYTQPAAGKVGERELAARRMYHYESLQRFPDTNE